MKKMSSKASKIGSFSQHTLGRWDIPAATEEEDDSGFVVRLRGNIMPRGSGGPRPRGKPQQQTSFDDDDDDDDDDEEEFTGR